MKRGWLRVATVLMAVLVTSCGGGSKSAEPDKVVGVLLKCTRPVVPAQELSSDMCQRVLNAAKQDGTFNGSVSRFNIRYVVTVRTSTGGGYSLEVPATTPVTVGQVWPPTR